jgi:hypothetical protein
MELVLNLVSKTRLRLRTTLEARRVRAQQRIQRSISHHVGFCATVNSPNPSAYGLRMAVTKIDSARCEVEDSENKSSAAFVDFLALKGTVGLSDDEKGVRFVTDQAVVANLVRFAHDKKEGCFSLLESIALAAERNKMPRTAKLVFEICLKVDAKGDTLLGFICIKLVKLSASVSETVAIFDTAFFEDFDSAEILCSERQ